MHVQMRFAVVALLEILDLGYGELAGTEIGTKNEISCTDHDDAPVHHRDSPAVF